MKKHRLASKSEKKGGSSAELPVRYLPLAGVLMGATLLAIGLVCLYVVMRAVGLEHGGTCVSGGAYEIAPGHECESGVFPLPPTGPTGSINPPTLRSRLPGRRSRSRPQQR